MSSAPEQPGAAPDQPDSTEPNPPQRNDLSSDSPAEQPPAAYPASAHEPLADEPPAADPESAVPTAPAQQPPAADPESAAPTAPAQQPPAADRESASATVDQPPTPDVPPEPPADEPARGRRGRRGGRRGRQQPSPEPSAGPDDRPAGGPEAREVVRVVGQTNERALRYVLAPDPQLSRLSRKVREALITDLPPVTAGALLGPAALARHFVASAASGRYRDLFALWELFRQAPEECKPVLAERQRALEKARTALGTAVRLGLNGHAERVAEDIATAQGLIWQWLREMLLADLDAVGRRPLVACALLRREPDLTIPFPEQPGERWLAEAAALRRDGPLPAPMEQALTANVHRLPATVATLALAHQHYRERVPDLVDRVDLDSPEIGSILAWARDHGVAERLRERVRRGIEQCAADDRAQGLAMWYAWRERGVDMPLPEALRVASLEGLDLGRPETGVLLARLLVDGAGLDPQATLEEVAGRNRQLAEKAFESFVCAGLDVRLPGALDDNPIVREGTRCPWCRAWTWVRPGHERRCPRRPAEAAAGTAGGPGAATDLGFDFAAASADEPASIDESPAPGDAAQPGESGPSGDPGR